MRLGHFAVHEDGFMAGEEHPSCECDDQGRTSNDHIASEMNTSPLCVIQPRLFSHGVGILSPTGAGSIEQISTLVKSCS